MSEVDAAIVFLPRFTTLAGASSFTTLPLDVSRFASAQFQLWRGPIRGNPPQASHPFLAYLEESLDAENWVLGPSTPTGFDPADDDLTLTRPKLFSYGFRLRWFRIRIELSSTNPIVTCWAEGLLRDGGGGGAWVQSAPSALASTSTGSVVMRPGTPLGAWSGTSLGAAIRPPAAPPASPAPGRTAGSQYGSANPLANLPSLGH